MTRQQEQAEELLALAKYLGTPEGRARVAEVSAECRAYNVQLDTQLRVDPADLKQRITL